MPASSYRNRLSFLSSGSGKTSKFRCFASLERDDDLAYLLIALKIPICVSDLFEREGTVHTGFERTIREMLIHVPLHAIESFGPRHLVHHVARQGNTLEESACGIAV